MGQRLEMRMGEKLEMRLIDGSDKTDGRGVWSNKTMEFVKSTTGITRKLN